VIPKLRAFCKQRKIHLVEVDLRWGVTEEESKSGKALEICLNEVDNAFIFCGLIGDRFGWVPKGNEIRDDLKVKFNITEGDSITAMEVYLFTKSHSEFSILYSSQIKRALSRKSSGDCHCFFFFRDSSFTSTLPKSARVKYSSTSADKQKLERLKSEIKNSRCPVTSYKPSFEGINGGLIKMGGLKSSFGKSFIENVEGAIEKEFPLTSREMDPLTEERFKIGSNLLLTLFY